MTREQIKMLKKDCESAGVDAVPALEALEISMFGREVTPFKIKKQRTKGQTGEAYCIEKVDKTTKKPCVAKRNENENLKEGRVSTKKSAGIKARNKPNPTEK